MNVEVSLTRVGNSARSFNKSMNQLVNILSANDVKSTNANATASLDSINADLVRNISQNCRKVKITYTILIFDGECMLRL